MQELCNFINGEWVTSPSGQFEEIPDPGTGEILARMPVSERSDVGRAVAAAGAAFPSWRETPVVERARYMFKYKQILEEHFEDLARLTVSESGKTLQDARGDIRRGIEVVEFAAGMPTLMMGSVLEDVGRGIDSEMIRCPLGVVGAITAFNFPAMIPLWLFPIAIACGNTFVLKPSDRTPLSSVRLAELLEGTGLPKGTFNLVMGGKEAAEGLLEHPGVKAVSFVGSHPVAKSIYEKACATGKRVQALAGAKNHLIVMPDADLGQTVPAILGSAFGNAGQRCLAGSVVDAAGDIADPLVNRLVEAASRLRVGPGSEDGVDIGAIVRPAARDRILSLVEKGVAEGAKLVLDGRKVGAGRSGWFVGPTIFDHVRPEMTIAQEEIFGPVLSVIRVHDLDEALQVANSSKFGNASAIFTTSGKAAREYRYRIQAGMVGVNVGVPAPMAFFPFGGWKQSFFGDLRGTGRDAVDFYTEKKMIVLRWF